MLAAVATGTTFGSGGLSWWQTMGSLLIVLGLLLLCLKLLGKWNHRKGGGAAARILTVWTLGPKREIQVLQLGEQVHYIYRYDNAMVMLREEPLASYEAARAASCSAGDTRSRWHLFPAGMSGLRPSHGELPDLTSS